MTSAMTSAIWRISAELDKPKRALLKMNLTSRDHWRLACFSHVFKLGIILNLNNKTIIEFGLRII